MEDYKISLVKSADLQELFGVASQTISNWIESGDLPEPIRMGKMRYWLKEEILEILNQRQEGPRVTREALEAHLAESPVTPEPDTKIPA